MPNPSWSQTAGPKYCGGYRGGKDSVCPRCYAGQGRFRFQNVREANKNRYNWFHDSPRDQVIGVLVNAYMGQRYARVFVSGDFCHVRCVDTWIEIVKRCPQTKWWFPTRCWTNKEYHPALRKLNKRPNVVVRLSNDEIGHPVPNEVRQSLGINTTSTVYDDLTASCPKQVSHGNCQDAGCLRCWDGRVQEITYSLNGGKVNWRKFHAL